MSLNEIPSAWLKDQTLPLWLKAGLDTEGNFVEALSQQGLPLALPRRALVQGRQLHVLRLARQKGWVPAEWAPQISGIMEKATQNLIRKYSLESGAFVHSVDVSGAVSNSSPELYTQAFCLFGLAQTFLITRKSEIKERALQNINYLEAGRKAPGGGYTEIKNHLVSYDSNPHMHLFEALLAWMEADPTERIWKDGAAEILDLCLNRFIDPESGAVIEFFDQAWKPLMLEKGAVVEPGHQFEWSWLMGWYQRLTGRDLSPVRQRLYEIGETQGLCPRRQVVIDELWSADLSPKLSTARFWPQCERIKCASQRGDARAVKSAMSALFQYFQTPTSGLWWDRMSENGTFPDEPAKASSLYHIIGAISESEAFF